MWFPNNKPNVACGTKTQQNNNTTNVVTTKFPTPTHQGGSGRRVTAVIAWGKRPVPFRTRKLRPTAPMVLHPGGCGRVGHRRTTIRSRPQPVTGWGLPHLNNKKATGPLVTFFIACSCCRIWVWWPAGPGMIATLCWFMILRVLSPGLVGARETANRGRAVWDRRA
jgi:hypothetical protein